MNYQIFVTESMFNVFDATLPNSSLKSELGYNCELLHVFFKDADKSIISVLGHSRLSPQRVVKYHRCFL